MVESAEYRRELEQKRSAYAFLSSLFLTLPDEELVASLQELAAAPASTWECMRSSATPASARVCPSRRRWPSWRRTGCT